MISINSFLDIISISSHSQRLKYILTCINVTVSMIALITQWNIVIGAFSHDMVLVWRKYTREQVKYDAFNKLFLGRHFDFYPKSLCLIYFGLNQCNRLHDWSDNSVEDI